MIHVTTWRRPAEVFATDELPELKPVSDEVFDIPTWSRPRVALQWRGDLITVHPAMAPGRRHTDQPVYWPRCRSMRCGI